MDTCYDNVKGLQQLTANNCNRFEDDEYDESKVTWQREGIE